MKKIASVIRRTFLRQEGGKEVANGGAFQILVWGVLAILTILKLLPGSVDTSFFSKSVLPFFGMGEKALGEEMASQASGPAPYPLESSPRALGIAERETPLEEPKALKRKKTLPPIRYAAKQVIVRREESGALNSLPVGTSAVGKTLNGIDTRNAGGMVRVLLPYGMGFKGTQKLPKGTVLLGSVSYPGNGEKFFLRFQRGLLPNGREFAISAEALNPKDFSAGLSGTHHDNADTRMATALGLSAMSTASGVLVEREALGYEVHPESSMKNAMLSALASTTEAEAQRKARSLRADREFATLAAGSELVVSLMEKFNISH